MKRLIDCHMQETLWGRCPVGEGQVDVPLWSWTMSRVQRKHMLTCARASRTIFINVCAHPCTGVMPRHTINN
jgi:hypothetical protein